MKNVILVFSFLILISCNSAKQESGKAQQEPVQTPKQEQPAAEVTQPTQPVEVEVSAQPSATQNQAEVMLNPPHGEPYHRCDIPVGAPLDSPPGKTRQTTNNQTTSSGNENQPSIQALENAMKTNPTQTRKDVPVITGNKPRLNPPHGQPHHRCDIPVGSPLR